MMTVVLVEVMVAVMKISHMNHGGDGNPLQ